MPVLLKEKLQEPIVGTPPVVEPVRHTTAPAGLVPGPEGSYQKNRKRLLHHNKKLSTWRYNLLAWLRDHVWRGLPRMYYQLVLGHDLHISTYAELYVRHFHYNQLDPLTGRLELHQVLMSGTLQTIPGWWEDVGLVSRGKVTVAFRTFEIANLAADSTEYGDYKFQRPGTDSTPESNSHTALIVDAGPEATGTQVDADPIYRSVATVTADATETWQEHSIRSQTGASGGTMMDRSLIIPTVSVVNLDTVEFTYEITKNAEA